jgi:hypothetical protein
MRERVRESGLPLVYAHLVGGQDEVVFEGHSFVVSADAEIAGRAPSFEEKLFYASVKRSVDAIDVVATWCRSGRWMPTSGTPWCWACVTTLARTAFRACCWACRAASTPRWCWRWRWMQSGATGCAR